MKEFGECLQVVCNFTDRWLNWFMGDCDNLLYTLMAFVVLNYMTEIMCAIADRKYSSKIGVRGIFGNILIFVLVGISHIFDAYVIASNSILRTAVISFYIATEGTSLLKNAVRLGLPVPQILKIKLEQFPDKKEK